MILRRDGKRRTEDLRCVALAQLNAAHAPWSTENAKRAADFINSLSGKDKAKPQQSMSEITRLFSQAGIPIEEV